MKRLYLKLAPCILLLAFLTRPAINTYSQLFGVGDKMINAGIGIGATYYHGYGWKTTLPPIFISGDYGFRDDIGPGVLGIGAYLGFNSYKWESTWLLTNQTYGWKYTSIIAGARGTYHYEFIETLDTYGGVLIGLRYTHDSYFGDAVFDVDPDSGIFPVFSFFAGGRYYFTDNIAILGELGWGIAWLSIGVTLKLQ